MHKTMTTMFASMAADDSVGLGAGERNSLQVYFRVI